jgi:hypothetical protein
MGLEFTLELQALGPSLSLSLGSRGFESNNAHTNAADHIFLTPNGSTWCRPAAYSSSFSWKLQRYS